MLEKRANPKKDTGTVLNQPSLWPSGSSEDERSRKARNSQTADPGAGSGSRVAEAGYRS